MLQALACGEILFVRGSTGGQRLPGAGHRLRSRTAIEDHVAHTPLDREREDLVLQNGNAPARAHAVGRGGCTCGEEEAAEEKPESRAGALGPRKRSAPS